MLGFRGMGTMKKVTFLFFGITFVSAILFINDIRKTVNVTPLNQWLHSQEVNTRNLAAGRDILTSKKSVDDIRKTANVTPLNQWLRSQEIDTKKLAAEREILISKKSVGPQVLHVLIVTYMRSGSSMAGDIMQQAGGAFYNYEPLRFLRHTVDKNKNVTFETVYGTNRYPPYDYENEALGVIRNWFSCRLQKLYTNSMQDGFLSKGLKTSLFHRCFREEAVRTRNKTIALHTCVNKLQKVCLESPVRVIKTIRMSLEAAKKLLTDFPNLKIIHLVRDPRATLSSQRRVGMCSAIRGGFTGCTNLYCKRVENDVLESEILHKKHPDNIKTLFYEDLALHPIETARSMYDYVGTTFTPRAEEYVYNITMAGNPNGCAICTTRTNSSEHVDGWKAKWPSLRENWPSGQCKQCRPRPATASPIPLQTVQTEIRRRVGNMAAGLGLQGLQPRKTPFLATPAIFI